MYKYLKRTPIILMLAFTLFFGVYACSSVENEKLIYDDYSDKQTDGVIFEIVDTSLSASGALFYIKNTGYGIINFGTEFILQTKDQNNWKDMEQKPGPWDWEAVAIELSPDMEFTRELYWGSLYGELTPGTYRILIPYSIRDNKTVLGKSKNNEKTYYMICEFEIT